MQFEIQLSQERESKAMIWQFHIEDNSLAFRWGLLVNRALQDPGFSPQAQCYGPLFNNQTQIEDELIDCYEKIRSASSVVLPKIHKEMLTKPVLSELHRIFEDRFDFPKKPRNETEFLLLNYLIHQYESVAFTNVPGGHIEFSFIDSARFGFFNLENSDYSLFTPHLEFGGIYLSYNQTGRSPLAAYHQQQAHLPTPQTRLTPDFFIFLRPDEIFTDQKGLSRYLTDLQRLHPKEKMRGIGHIKLGNLKNSDFWKKLLFQKNLPHPKIVKLGGELIFSTTQSSALQYPNY